MSDSALTIDVDPTDKRGKVIIVVRQDGNTLAAETVNILSAEKRKQFLESLQTDNPGLSESVLQQVKAELLKVAGDVTVPEAKQPIEPENPLDSMPDDIKSDALSMLRDPNLVPHISADIARLGVAGERVLSMLVYLIGTSRLLGKPLSGIVQGPSSSGKSYVIDEVASLFPPEAVLRAHKMTPQALVHLPKGALEHRFVVAGERSRKQDDDTAETTRALREMISDGKLTKLMPVKQGGQIVTITIEQPGPIAFIESTTLQNIFNEDRNRCLVIATDETPEQTKRILENLGKSKANLSAEGTLVGLRDKHFAAQRMLHRCKVVIPFAPQLAQAFPSNRTDARRSFGQLLSLIEAITLLYQYQRTAEPQPDSVLFATEFDYELARKLVGDLFGASADTGLTPAVVRFAKRLFDSFELNEEFDARDVAAKEPTISDLTTIRQYLRILVDNRLLEQTEPHRGQQPARYKLVSKELDDGRGVGLPMPVEIFNNTAPKPPLASSTNGNHIADNDLRRGSANSATNLVSASNDVVEETGV